MCICINGYVHAWNVRLSMDRWVWLSTMYAYGISHNACVCSLTMAGVEHQLGLGLYHDEQRGGALTEQHALHPQWVAVRVGGRGKWWEVRNDEAGQERPDQEDLE